MIIYAVCQYCGETYKYVGNLIGEFYAPYVDEPCKKCEKINRITAEEILEFTAKKIHPCKFSHENLGGCGEDCICQPENCEIFQPNMVGENCYNCIHYIESDAGEFPDGITSIRTEEFSYCELDDEDAEPVNPFEPCNLWELK